ncbi:hypothetical protein GCM10010124_11770 [Pilimelia terevasa]|uniref:Tyrosinase n=1 Tax=Pilimelia terevasa TaxID=53372 RepID=A0A8J3BHX9_9ACTN|nr:tyrosinase family oxidase copper chaperone [Pilimelia terevasa]GGK20919.1 hypothetical protein GCM10010124_11770 [Pilimelia terevasa]
MLTRRRLLRYGAAGACALGTAALGVERATRGEAATAAVPDLTARGLRALGGTAARHVGRLVTVARYADAGGATVAKAFIDGVELHVMAHPRGGYVSAVAHYERRGTFAEAAALAAVRLDGLALLPPDHHH